jgi:hypothetical protein
MLSMSKLQPKTCLSSREAQSMQVVASQSLPTRARLRTTGNGHLSGSKASGITRVLTAPHCPKIIPRMMFVTRSFYMSRYRQASPCTFFLTSLSAVALMWRKVGGGDGLKY